MSQQLLDNLMKDGKISKDDRKKVLELFEKVIQRFFPEYGLSKGFNLDQIEELKQAGDFIAQEIISRQGWLSITWIPKPEE